MLHLKYTPCLYERGLSGPDATSPRCVMTQRVGRHVFRRRCRPTDRRTDRSPQLNTLLGEEHIETKSLCLNVHIRVYTHINTHTKYRVGGSHR